jgi:anti-sigma factor RsiW
MSECPLFNLIPACHDGELDADKRQALLRHAETCPDCAAELAWLQSVSRTLTATGAPDITEPELVRLHEAVESADAAEGRGVLRIGGALAALAASIIVVSGVWISELGPAPAATRAPSVSVAEAPAWERVAVTLRVDLPASELNDEVFLADAGVADWMLNALDKEPTHANY